MERPLYERPEVALFEGKMSCVERRPLASRYAIKLIDWIHHLEAENAELVTTAAEANLAYRLQKGIVEVARTQQKLAHAVAKAKEREGKG